VAEVGGHITGKLSPALVLDNSNTKEKE